MPGKASALKTAVSTIPPRGQIALSTITRRSEKVKGCLRSAHDALKIQRFQYIKKNVESAILFLHSTNLQRVDSLSAKTSI